MIRSTLLILQHIFVALVCVLSLPYAIALTAEPFLLDGLYGGFAVVGLFVWSLLFSPIVFGLVYWLSRGLLKKKRIYNPRKVGIQLSSFSLGLILLLCLQTVAAPYGLRLHDSYHDRHFSNRVIDYHFFGAHVGLFGVFGVRVRMEGVCFDDKCISRFFILWLGIAPNFSVFFCEFRPAGCLALWI